MIKIFLILTWIIYSIVDGLTDGFTFSKAYKANNFDNNWFGFDIHTWFTVKRFIAFSYISIFTFLYFGYEVCIIISIGNAFVFPFLHDGTMYLSRKKNYPKGFFHDPTINNTSSAKISLSTNTRTFLFTLGFSGYIILFFN